MFSLRRRFGLQDPLVVLCVFVASTLWTARPYIVVFCAFSLRQRFGTQGSTWAFQLLKNISRFEQSGVSLNLWSYRAFPQKVRRGKSWLCFPSAWPCLLTSILLSKYGAAHPSWFLFNCALPKLYKLLDSWICYTNLPDSWICGRFLVFAGVLRFFAGGLREILGAVMCIYMRWCSGYENGLVCLWDAARMQAMFSHIQKMSIMVIVWPLGSKTRQTSRIRRDSENWVVLGHTPKLPKIIDRRTVQVVVFCAFSLRQRFGLQDPSCFVVRFRCVNALDCKIL